MNYDTDSIDPSSSLDAAPDAQLITGFLNHHGSYSPVIIVELGVTRWLRPGLG
jgi:hypothetical protein